MSAPHRDHLTLAVKAFHKRTGYLPRGPWVAWADLLGEAAQYDLPKSKARLEALLETSPSIGGWGQTRLVEGMRGEVKPETQASGAWLGAPATTIVQMAPPQQAMPSQVEERKRRGILGRLRR